MGGFVRVFSSRNGSSGSGNVNNQIIFSNPVIFYSYDNDSYQVLPNKNGFAFVETTSHNNEDNEGVALFVAGLDPVKDYIVNFTLRASSAANTTYQGQSNAVGFTQSFDNVKNLGVNRIFAITHNTYNDIYKSMRFDNGVIGGSSSSPEITNYIPITSVSTTPAEYSLTIKRGCNGSALLCFELAFPNQAPMTYYFENFSITDAESPISEGEPLSLYCFSEEAAHINGSTAITNLVIDNVNNPYQVVKVNASGKCSNGKVTISMKYGSTQLPTTVVLGEISGEEDFNISYNLGISSFLNNNLNIIATYNPGIYNSESGTPYTPVAGIYSDDEVEISCIATGSDSVLLENSYSNPSRNLMASVESETMAQKIATDVGIILNLYSAGVAEYTTYEDVYIVKDRATSLGYNLVLSGSATINPITPISSGDSINPV